MSNTIYDLLMITSFNLDTLIEEYRQFFMSLLPGMFIFACLIEYFDRMNVFQLVKRGLIAVLLLTSISSFYKTSIEYSIEAANTKFSEQKFKNILLMDMFEASKYFDNIEDTRKSSFFKDNGYLKGGLKFLKYHFFDSFVNDGFTIGVYFFSQLCFLLIKVIYSLVYYLGYGLIGIPVLIYLFPTMGNVLRGSILSFIWCLIVPHVLVFVLSMIGSEINKGYESGQIIGGSLSGTVLLSLLTLFIAFTPFISMMLINGSGVAQAGGLISLVGGNFLRSLPMSGINSGASFVTGGGLGPKGKVAMGLITSGATLATGSVKGAKGVMNGFKRPANSKIQQGANKMSDQHLDANTISKQIKSYSSSMDMNKRNSTSNSDNRFRSASEVRFKLNNNSQTTNKDNLNENIKQRQNEKGARSSNQHRRDNQVAKTSTNVNRNNWSYRQPIDSMARDNSFKRREKTSSPKHNRNVLPRND